MTYVAYGLFGKLSLCLFNHPSATNSCLQPMVQSQLDAIQQWCPQMEIARKVT